MNYVYMLHQDQGCIDLSLDDAFQMKHERDRPLTLSLQRTIGCHSAYKISMRGYCTISRVLYFM